MNLTCQDLVKDEMKNRASDIIRFMNNTDNDYIMDEFLCYGLSWDVVEEGTFTDQDEAYLRFQISWGGPSEEIRYFKNGRIEFWYLDWYDGAFIDISDKDWAKWLLEFYGGWV